MKKLWLESLFLAGSNLSLIVSWIDLHMQLEANLLDAAVLVMLLDWMHLPVFVLLRLDPETSVLGWM